MPKVTQPWEAEPGPKASTLRLANVQCSLLRPKDYLYVLLLSFLDISLFLLHPKFPKKKRHKSKSVYFKANTNLDLEVAQQILHHQVLSCHSNCSNLILPNRMNSFISHGQMGFEWMKVIAVGRGVLQITKFRSFRMSNSHLTGKS